MDTADGQDSMVGQADSAPGSDSVRGGSASPSREVAELLDGNARVARWWNRTWPWLAPFLFGVGIAIGGYASTPGSAGTRLGVAVLALIPGALLGLRVGQAGRLG
jgi:hypothetical protein